MPQAGGLVEQAQARRQRERERPLDRNAHPPRRAPRAKRRRAGGHVARWARRRGGGRRARRQSRSAATEPARARAEARSWCRRQAPPWPRRQGAPRARLAAASGRRRRAVATSSGLPLAPSGSRRPRRFMACCAPPGPRLLPPRRCRSRDRGFRAAAGLPRQVPRHHPVHRQEVQRAVEHREGGALAGAVQGGARVEAVATLDVDYRQCHQGTAHLLEGEARQMSLLESCAPAREALRQGFGNRARPRGRRAARSHGRSPWRAPRRPSASLACTSSETPSTRSPALCSPAALTTSLTFEATTRTSFTSVSSAMLKSPCFENAATDSRRRCAKCKPRAARRGAAPGCRLHREHCAHTSGRSMLWSLGHAR